MNKENRGESVSATAAGQRFSTVRPMTQKQLAEICAPRVQTCIFLSGSARANARKAAQDELGKMVEELWPEL
jgi:hypothetical protein